MITLMIINYSNIIKNAKRDNNSLNLVYLCRVIKPAQLLNVTGIEVHIDDCQVLKYQPSEPFEDWYLMSHLDSDKKLPLLRSLIQNTKMEIYVSIKMDQLVNLNMD